MTDPLLFKYDTSTNYELEVTFPLGSAGFDLDAMSAALAAVVATDPTDPRLKDALFLGSASSTDADDHAENLGYVRQLFESPHAFLYRRFTNPDSTIMYRFFSHDGRGYDESKTLLYCLVGLLAIPEIFEASGAAGFVVR